MAIKVTEDEKGIQSYPYLGIGNDKTIVLFHSTGKGTVVGENGFYPLGRYSETWIEENFTLYNGKITLENE